ncbi:microtubule-associated protein 1S-like [Schistocerca piceifrons]|uniref:microtubule-associated protein 1S-like n=1 Tax=Schistocerca piceifrons TaxID=274613 RepID=UPI001F5E6911|nr:microtubule-associated protein 1S-like [Schistocerca piceifrons]
MTEIGLPSSEMHSEQQQEIRSDEFPVLVRRDKGALPPAKLDAATNKRRRTCDSSGSDTDASSAHETAKKDDRESGSEAKAPIGEAIVDASPPTISSADTSAEVKQLPLASALELPRQPTPADQPVRVAHIPAGSTQTEACDGGIQTPLSADGTHHVAAASVQDSQEGECQQLQEIIQTQLSGSVGDNKPLRAENVAKQADSASDSSAARSPAVSPRAIPSRNVPGEQLDITHDPPTPPAAEVLHSVRPRIRVQPNVNAVRKMTVEKPPTSQPTVLPVTYAAALASPTTLQRRPVTTNDATNEPDQTLTESASDDPPPRPAIDAAPKMPTQPDADPDLGNTMEIDSLIVPTAAFLPERRDSLPSSDTEGRTRKQRSPKRRKRRRRTVSGQEETLQVEEDVPVDQHEASEPATADEDVMSAETSIAVEKPPTSQPTVLPVTYAAALASPTTLQRRPVTTNDATNEPDQTLTESASDDPPPRPAIDAAPKMPTQPDADPDLGNTMEIDSLIVPTAAFLPERRDSLPSSDTEGRTRKQRSPKRRKRRRRTVSGQEETLQVEEDVPVDQHEASEPATADEDVMSAETSIGVPAPRADAELNHERLTGDTTPRTITTSSEDKMDDTPVSASTAWHEEEVTEQEPLRDPAPSRPHH